VRAPVLALGLLTAACGGPAGAPPGHPVPVWTLAGFSEPESVAVGGDGRTLYVTNVGGEAGARDGNGYISRVSTAGKLIQQRWVTGLDAPKGAIVAGGRLYVSDIDRLVEIDIAAGQVVARYPAPGATFLNDVAVTPDGTVLVSDSGTGRIFSLTKGRMGVWAADPLLKSVNGLLAEPKRLVVATMEGRLLAVDYGARTVKVLAEGLGQADGVAPAGDGGWFVGEYPGRLFLVPDEGATRVLIDSRSRGIQINDFIRVGDLLIAPNWTPGSLTAYRVTDGGLAAAGRGPGQG
jgi:DNA-binding beta-propeller fold protein YncE